MQEGVFLVGIDYLRIMDFDKFSDDKSDCHVSENGFLMWRLTGESSFRPCVFEGDIIISHILVCRGELSISYAGSRYLLAAGDFASLVDHFWLQLLSVSPDIEAYIVVGKKEFFDRLLTNNPPIPFSFVLKRRMNPVESIDMETAGLLRRRMECIREACGEANHIFRDKMIKCAIMMLLMDIADRHIRNGGKEDPAGGSERRMRLFVGFMHLLPTNVAREHFTGFYADSLCVTPQYLNRVVKSLSGRTVTGWINFTLVGEITKRLDNTDETMQQIATALGFPDQATLAKFFKRETGRSPREHRKSVGKRQ